MKDFFLKAKHWQLFVLTFGIPFILQSVLIAMMMVRLVASEEINPFIVFDYFRFFPVIVILFMAVHFGWLWSVATGLQEKMPRDVRMNVARFKTFFLIPIIYILFISVFVAQVIGGVVESNEPPDVFYLGGLMAVIVPLHLFSVFCIFYSLYFVAKTFKTVELQREVNFSDFIGEFFLIWFYPIGIWFIQPTINKMVEQSERSEN